MEGFGWLLANLAAPRPDPGSLLRAIRLTESEPSRLRVSPQLVVLADSPGGSLAASPQ